MTTFKLTCGYHLSVPSQPKDWWLKNFSLYVEPGDQNGVQTFNVWVTTIEDYDKHARTTRILTYSMCVGHMWNKLVDVVERGFAGAEHVENHAG